MFWSILIPKCPATMPIKNTNVAPNDTPSILILPNDRPTAQRNDNTITA